VQILKSLLKQKKTLKKKNDFEKFASQYTNLNFVTADSQTYAGSNWAIMYSKVLKYSDYSVGGYISPPTLVAYANGVRKVAPVVSSTASSTEAYLKSAGG
jgi:hypothetical protein